MRLACLYVCLSVWTSDDVVWSRSPGGGTGRGDVCRIRLHLICRLQPPTSSLCVSKSCFHSHVTIQVKLGVVRFFGVGYRDQSVTDPGIWQPGFNLPRRTWGVLNRFHTSQGLCAANLYTSGAWRFLSSTYVRWSRRCHIQ